VLGIAQEPITRGGQGDDRRPPRNVARTNRHARDDYHSWLAEDERLAGATIRGLKIQAHCVLSAEDAAS
jgi:hypothetical protein